MPTTQMTRAIHQLKEIALAQDAATDAQLLERFVKLRDGEALATLVRRHGPMVWGVCRRVVGEHHAAEDAFQATFLVLVRRAAAIIPRDNVASWLHGVARQTALKARSTIITRKVREKQVSAMPEPAVAPAAWREIEPILDQELDALPDKYRLPLLLCDLEGKTRGEVATQLGWPEGTVAGRLARARSMLAKRLMRRGVSLSVGALAATLGQGALSAGVPASLVSATITTSTTFAAGQTIASAQVALLTQGVLKMMLFAKLKASALLVSILLTLGVATVGTIAYPSAAADRGSEAVAAPPEEFVCRKGRAAPVVPPTVVVPAQNAAAPKSDPPAPKIAPPPAPLAQFPAPKFRRRADMFEELSHDFGAQPAGGIVKWSFRMTNSDENAWRFVSVRVSCNTCAQAKIAKEVLVPNEQGELVVTLDTGRFTGQKLITIFVVGESVTGRWEEVRLWVQCVSR